MVMGDNELIVVGEFMGIEIFKNDGGKLSRVNWSGNPYRMVECHYTG